MAAQQPAGHPPHTGLALTAADAVRPHSGAGGGAELSEVGGGGAVGGERLQGKRTVGGRREDRQPRLVRGDGEAQEADGAIEAA